jgi:hypothetical protein
MDPNVKVLEAADSYALISVPAAKVMAGISVDDTSLDAQIKMLIDQNSAIVANKCERTFAREKVVETWFAAPPVGFASGMARVYLTHAPVRSVDIVSVETAGTVLDPADYTLEERTGKLTFPSATGELVVTYTGGYALPSEAPLDLQYYVGLSIRQYRTAEQQAGVAGSGVRMVAHRETRIMYHSPKDLAASTSTASTTTVSAGSTSERALDALIQRYKRMWI